MAQPAPISETARLSAAESKYNTTTWGLLYGALVNGLGLSPANFQLIYPFVSWNWVPANRGYTVAPQYDFCATMPQWSATGVYSSAAGRFSDAYRSFLYSIKTNATDPRLQQQISVQQGKVQLAKNDLDTVRAQASLAYKAETEKNTPVYDVWLGSPAGSSWQMQIATKEVVYRHEGANLTTLMTKEQVPGLSQALKRLDDHLYYTKYQDPGLSDFPPQPAWSMSQNSVSWTQMVQAGDGTPGSLGFSMRDQSYNYKNTWAEGSASVDEFFWEVAVNGKWQKIESFMSDQNLSVTIGFKAWDQVSITPGGWYDGGFVNFHKNGPFIEGYTGYDDGSGNTCMWGPAGTMNLMKTGMLVAYQPKVSLALSQSAYKEFYQTWKIATGFRIGPFTFGGEAGQIKNTWTKKESGLTLTADSTSTIPVIFGITIDELP